MTDPDYRTDTAHHAHAGDGELCATCGEHRSWHPERATMTREQYLATVLDKEQQRALARWQSPGGMTHDERPTVVAIIDRLIDAQEAAESRLAAVRDYRRELREKPWSWPRKETIIDALDRILDDTPTTTGGTET